MKRKIKLFSTLVPLFVLSVFVSGCYTQLATTSDEGEGSYRAPSRVARTYDQNDTSAANQQAYYDDYDQQQGRYRVGFGYYYPSSWYWDFAFGDPYYYGYPYYGYGWPYYGGMYGYPGYYGYGWGANYYGGFYGYGYYPYRYYTGYPFVVYGTAARSASQTRNSGYRRTGFSRSGGYMGATGVSTTSSLGVSPASRRSSGQGSGTVAPATRRNNSPAVRGTTRNTAPQSGSRSGTVSSPSRSGSARIGSAPSGGGSRSPSGSTRSSGSSRGRGSSDAPASGYYRPSAGSDRTGSPSWAPRSAPSPSYTPGPSSSPSPSSPAPSSGGSSGGSRGSGATRTGRN